MHKSPHKRSYVDGASPLAGFELTTLVVIGNDCIGSCKSNSHTITTTTAPSCFNIKTLYKIQSQQVYKNIRVIQWHICLGVYFRGRQTPPPSWIMVWGSHTGKTFIYLYIHPVRWQSQDIFSFTGNLYQSNNLIPFHSNFLNLFYMAGE